MTQGSKHALINATVVGSFPYLLGGMKYLIFSFLTSGNETKRGVHLTHNVKNSMENVESKCLNGNVMS